MHWNHKQGVVISKIVMGHTIQSWLCTIVVYVFLNSEAVALVLSPRREWKEKKIACLSALT